MAHRIGTNRLAFLALSLASGASLAQQQDSALAYWYAQQATQVRTLIDQLGSNDADRQKFALWQLELELALPPGTETQPMLEEAAGAGVLSALERLSSASDPEVAASASQLRANLIDALGLAARPQQTRTVLSSVASESLQPVDYASWLALETEAGTEYRIRASDCDLVSTLVVNRDDLSVLEGGFGVNTSFAFTSTADDTVLMRIRAAHCASGGSIRISSGAPLRSIAGSTTRQSAASVAEGRFFGHLAENDQQWVALQVRGGRSIEIVADPGGSGLDTFLRLYDAEGRVQLAEDDDGGSGLGSRLIYTSGADADVLLEISRLGSDWGEYELSIAEILPPAERGRLVDPGVAYTGDLTFEPREWWRFEPEAGVRYRLEAEPNDSLDTYAKIYEINGETLIDENDDGGPGLGSRLDFTRPTGSPVLIEVSSLNGNPGTYRFSIRENTLRFDHAEHAIGAGRYRGHVAHGRESYWRLDTPRGRYRAEVLPHGGLDPQITLYDAEGFSQLGYDDDGGQGFGSRLDFVADSDTNHVLSVSSFTGSGDFELWLSALPNPAQFAAAAKPGDRYRELIRYDDNERWWQIETQSGVAYEFEAVPRDGLDTIMELYAADGVTRLDQDDDGGLGLGSKIRYFANSDGLVLIRVSGLNGSEGDFEFQVR